MSWFRWDGPDLLLSVYVQPGASRTAIVGMHGDALKVRVTAPPQDGRANRAVAALMASRLDVRPKHVAVQQGGTGRRKLLRVSNVGRSERLCELLERIGSTENDQLRH